MRSCICGTGNIYQDCCGAFISGVKKPVTPEELMRSRYTAFTQAKIDYLASTMKSPAADKFDLIATHEWAKKVKWIGLEVVETSLNETLGFVEFIAYLYEDNRKQTIHEISEFHRIDDVWFYVDGKLPQQRSHVPTSRIGRNDSCQCDSGKKYKKCCGATRDW